ncbi:YWFCY domain-containing protein [Bacteroides uniformis]|nr:YWFCY domain-containing protein [Bacteroides uniformis]
MTKVFAVIFLALSCLGTKGVKNQKMTWRKIYTAFLSGLVLFFMNWWMLDLPFNPTVNAAIYTVTLTAGYILLLMSGVWISRMLKHNLMEDVFNTANESFMQETRFMENEYSVNLPTKFVYRGQGMGRMDQRCKRFSCVHRAWNTGQREILRGGKQLHQTANREILCHVHL